MLEFSFLFVRADSTANIIIISIPIKNLVRNINVLLKQSHDTNPSSNEIKTQINALIHIFNIIINYAKIVHGDKL